eukprot:351138-Chlamydomonas_euryale.AAC.8
MAEIEPAGGRVACVSGSGKCSVHEWFWKVQRCASWQTQKPASWTGSEPTDASRSPVQWLMHGELTLGGWRTGAPIRIPTENVPTEARVPRGKAHAQRKACPKSRHPPTQKLSPKSTPWTLKRIPKLGAPSGQCIPQGQRVSIAGVPTGSHVPSETRSDNKTRPHSKMFPNNASQNQANWQHITAAFGNAQPLDENAQPLYEKGGPKTAWAVVCTHAGWRALVDAIHCTCYIGGTPADAMQHNAIAMGRPPSAQHRTVQSLLARVVCVGGALEGPAAAQTAEKRGGI